MKKVGARRLVTKEVGQMIGDKRILRDKMRDRSGGAVSLSVKNRMKLCAPPLAFFNLHLFLPSLPCLPSLDHPPLLP